MKKPTLKDILIADEENAKTSGYDNTILPAGEYDAKILNFTEEENYQYIAMEINGKRFNMFYNYYIYNTTDLDGNLIKWMKNLATIKVTDKTTLLEIANSSIGSTYRITISNYIPKSGKNQGKEQHAISFQDMPQLVVQDVAIENEELDEDDLPF